MEGGTDMRKLIVAAAVALVAVPAAAAAKPGPSPALVWASGVEVGYTETVRDGLGNVVSQVHRDGIPAGVQFGNAAVGPPGSITTLDPAPASARRLAGCCSSYGSDTVSFEVTKRSLLGFVAWRYHQVDHWCWSYPSITCLGIGAGFYDIDSTSNVNWSDNGYGWYYGWAGSGTGGHYAHRDGSVSNCIFKYGCLATAYPYVDMWLNGNGAWAASGGGN
jgi:hypothetical protein